MMVWSSGGTIRMPRMRGSRSVCRNSLRMISRTLSHIGLRHFLTHFVRRQCQDQYHVDGEEQDLRPEHGQPGSLEEDTLEDRHEVPGGNDECELLNNPGHGLDGINEAG